MAAKNIFQIVTTREEGGPCLPQVSVGVGNMSTLAPIPMDGSTPVQPTAMDTETNITTTDQTLTHIPEETTAEKSTTIDVTPEEPATVAAPPAPTLDPCIYHTTLSVLPVPPMMATIAAARYITPVRISQQIISDSQWKALAADLNAYHFPSPRPGMLFLEHHWMDYLDALRNEIQRISLSPPMPMLPVLQLVQITQMAPIDAQAALLLPAAQLPPTVPMDVHPPQVPSTSVPAVGHHGPPIRKTFHQMKTESTGSGRIPKSPQNVRDGRTAHQTNTTA
uniref:Uncharacterized protein n=1 Tax=Romanomermis culicivorax TaxID=13658 RepID=A0A915HL72_ROMCU